MNELQTQDWYTLLLEDLKSIATESVFASRQELIKGKWLFGERIFKENDNFERIKIYGKEIVNTISKDLNRNYRDIYRCVQFYKKYPQKDFDMVCQNLPEGKNISWYKIANLYLTTPEEDKKELPKNKYSVIYADPPWPYPNRYLAQRYGGAISEHYPTMSIDNLCQLKVSEIANENSVLFIWVATNFLEDSFKIINNWGFEYKSQMVWVKTPLSLPSVGYYVRSHHELLLIATKGSYLPKTKEYVRSVIEAPRGEHSQKPEVVYEIIEKLYPKDKYIELFARRKRDGWQSWGNQV